METFKPAFICPHCEKELETNVFGNQGSVGACDCQESRAAWETKHRAEMERRKRRRGKRTR